MLPSIIDEDRRITTNPETWRIRRIVRRYMNPEDTDYDYENTRLRVPLYQRKWSWKNSSGLEKMRRLIDSILHGYPIPAIILNHTEEDGNDFWDIYDGRHRIETVWRFYNNQFSLRLMDGRFVYYRDLCDVDKERFLDAPFATLITENAPIDQLSEVFIRLNSGSPLKDRDLCWANRSKPLIEATINTLTANAERLRRIFGPKVNLSSENTIRSQLHNWAGLINGFNTRSAANMTTSYIRLSAHLDDVIDQEAINQGLDLICTLYERANARYPETDASRLQKHARLGHVIAFFYHDITHLSDEETERPLDQYDDVTNHWVEVIGHLRKFPESPLLITPGAQNLNYRKVSQVVRRVRNWFAGEDIDGVPIPFHKIDSVDDSDDNERSEDET